MRQADPKWQSPGKGLEKLEIPMDIIANYGEHII